MRLEVLKSKKDLEISILRDNKRNQALGRIVELNYEGLDVRLQNRARCASALAMYRTYDAVVSKKFRRRMGLRYR